jgi:Protein phosphatase 2C
VIYWDGAYRVNGQLAVSRAIGRFFIRPSRLLTSLACARASCKRA